MSPARVFIVEEDCCLRELLLELLLPSGDRLDTFESSDDAMGCVAENGPPDVVYFGSLRLFLDVVSGQRVAALGRAGIVVATGALQVPAFERVERLRKPFGIDHFISAVARAKGRLSILS